MYKITLTGLGKTHHKDIHNYLVQNFGNCDGYDFPNKNSNKSPRLPHWNNKDFEDLRKAVFRYAKTKREKNMEQEFKTWLLRQKTQQGNPFTETQHFNPFRQLLKETIPSWSAVEYDNLFTITDSNVIDELYKRCLKGRDLHRLNIEYRRSLPSIALKWYKKFLEQRNNNTEYTWVPFFIELSGKLVDKTPQKLSNLLIETFDRLNLKSNFSKQIDPFSLFAKIISVGHHDSANDEKDKRRIALTFLKKELKIQSVLPKDYNGVPSSMAMKAFLFPWDNSDYEQDVQLLCELFKQSQNNTIQAETFNNALKIKHVGYTKLTQALFWSNPKNHFPVDGQTTPYFKLANFPENYQGYQQVLKEIKQYNKNHYQLSHEAWLKDAVIATTSEPLNQILYGPPGTGKTYSTIERALNILGYQEENGIKSISELKKIYPEQVEFITFHQSFSYEDFIEGLKAQTTDGKIEYAIESGVFKRICQKAGSGENNFEECYNKLINDIHDNGNQLLSVEIGEDKTFNIRANSNQNLSLHTGAKKQKNGVLTKERIYQEYIGNPAPWWSSYYKGIIAHLKKQHQLVDYQSKNNKNYVLIIDEINRGNISQILGELITLIEPNKRMGKPEELSVQLPYSKDHFSVPSNLYIIATMNTADRSLTLLDTALRRRFEFREMPPDSSKISGINVEEIDLVQLLNTINKRILFLYDKEHQIGHSYLMKVKSLADLQQAFKTKILPLLEEYFFDDWQKIRQVLNDNDDKSYFYEEIKATDNLKHGNKKVYRRIKEPVLEAFRHIYQNTNDNEQGN